MIQWNKTLEGKPHESCECLIVVDGVLCLAWYSWNLCDFLLNNGNVVSPSHWMTQKSILDEAQ